MSNPNSVPSQHRHVKSISASFLRAMPDHVRVNLSRCGKFFLVLGRDYPTTLYVRTPAGPLPVFHLAISARSGSFSFSRTEGTRELAIVFVDGRAIRLRIDTPEPMAQDIGLEDVEKVVYSAGATHLIVGQSSGRLSLFDLSNPMSSVFCASFQLESDIEVLAPSNYSPTQVVAILRNGSQQIVDTSNRAGNFIPMNLSSHLFRASRMVWSEYHPHLPIVGFADEKRNLHLVRFDRPEMPAIYIPGDGRAASFSFAENESSSECTAIIQVADGVIEHSFLAAGPEVDVAGQILLRESSLLISREEIEEIWSPFGIVLRRIRASRLIDSELVVVAEVN